MAVHRVVTKRLDHRGRWIVETGPWHIWPSDAENWATILRHMGYSAYVETLPGTVSPHDHTDDDYSNSLSHLV